MNRPRQFAVLALALTGIAGLAHGATLPSHNDMDGDGRSDVIWRNATTGEIVYWPAGNAALAKRVLINFLYNLPTDFSLAQSSDAFAMRLWGGARTGVLVVSRGGYNAGLQFNYERQSGYRAYYDSTALPPAWKLVGTGDFGNLVYRGNYDVGIDDIVFRNQSDGRNMLSFMGWDHRINMEITPVGDLRWNVAGVGDFDGDGNADLLWRHFALGRNVIWPAANYAKAISLPQVPDLAWKVAAVADFNGDGRADIFWRNTSTGANVVWESGSTVMPRAAGTVADQGWQVAAVGDFDADGKSDLFWRNTRTGRNVIWKSANIGTQQAATGITNMAWRPLR